MSRVVVYGASGHGRSTIDALERAGLHTVVGVIDDAAEPGTLMHGYPILGGGDRLPELCEEHHITGGIVAIGDNFVRSRVVARIEAMLPDFEFVNAIHPFTSITRDVKIGRGVIIMAGGVVNASCELGDHTFILSNSSLDHDSRMGRFSSLAPRVATGGGVVLEDFAALAVGSVTIHGVHIGEHTVVGAGAVVVNDMPGHVVAYGTPCRVIRSRRPGDRYL